SSEGVALYDSVSGRKRRDLLRQPVRLLAWSRDSARVVSVSGDGVARIHSGDGAELFERRVPAPPASIVSEGALAWVVAQPGGERSTIEIADLHSGAVVRRQSLPGSFSGLAIDDNGRFAAGRTTDFNLLRLFDLETQQTAPVASQVMPLVSPHGDFIGVAGD